MQIEASSKRITECCKYWLRNLFVGVTLMGSAMALKAQVSYCPMTFRQVSGTRPFIHVLMNGKPFLLMVHSNASFYVMTTHELATEIGVPDVRKTSTFGISAAGHVDAKGRGEAILTSLRVADITTTNVPLSVFEQPEPDMEGMLGIKWLRASRIIVDYDQGRLGVAPTTHDSAIEDRRILSRQYTAHRMLWDDREHRYYVLANVEGKEARLTVSTVANDVLEMGFAKELHLALGPVVDRFDGPTGSVGDAYLAKRRLGLTLDGRKTESIQPQIIDFYAYNLKQRPSLPSEAVQGNLGADFMLANQAIIDFGSGMLFLPKR